MISRRRIWPRMWSPRPWSSGRLCAGGRPEFGCGRWPGVGASRLRLRDAVRRRVEGLVARPERVSEEARERLQTHRRLSEAIDGLPEAARTVLVLALPGRLVQRRDRRTTRPLRSRRPQAHLTGASPCCEKSSMRSLVTALLGPVRSVWWPWAQGMGCPRKRPTPRSRTPWRHAPPPLRYST